jgi:hypothetical protein
MRTSGCEKNSSNLRKYLDTKRIISKYGIPLLILVFSQTDVSGYKLPKK